MIRARIYLALKLQSVPMVIYVSTSDFVQAERDGAVVPAMISASRITIVIRPRVRYVAPPTPAMEIWEIVVCRAETLLFKKRSNFS